MTPLLCSLRAESAPKRLRDRATSLRIDGLVVRHRFRRFATPVFFRRQLVPRLSRSPSSRAALHGAIPFYCHTIVRRSAAHLTLHLCLFFLFFFSFLFFSFPFCVVVRCCCCKA